MLRFVSRVLVCALVPLFVGEIAAAQCPTPDGLDGTACCAVANPVLPKLPRFVQNSIEICWRDCNVVGITNYRAVWTNVKVTTSNGTPCDDRWVRVDLLDAAGVLQWTGQLRLQYARTWRETDPGGMPLQVWRFLVNGDMRPMMQTPISPCPVPACAPAFSRNVRFTGYIDYAASCALVPVVFQQAWMLTHACDFVDHHAGFPRAGAFHPNFSYTFVGPSAGFVPSSAVAPEPAGGGGFEAMRRRTLPAPGTVFTVCNLEERLVFGLTPNALLCLCGAPGTNQFQLANLVANGTCGSSATTAAGSPFLPGFVSMSIGGWTVPATFPGVESVRWNAADYTWVDGCTGVVRQEVFFGATTSGGYPAVQVLAGPGLPLPPTFIDQSNSLRTPSGVATIMNVPYVSDHFLNLNL